MNWTTLNLGMSEHPPPILLNPGPVNLSPGVRAALTKPDLCHREPEFADLQAGIRANLLDVYDLTPSEWTSVLLAGSGTAAVEAMLTSVVAEDGKVLVIENGVYGERMARMCKVHGIDHCEVTHAWGDAIDLEAVAKELDLNTRITHVAAVHHETTTGRLNDLEALADLCRGHGIPVLLDGVSSFAAEALNFDSIAACAATASKCLHGVPGVSFVIARRDLLSSESPKRTLYLDLATYCHEQDERNTPFTQPVQIYYALEQALTELEAQGGWRARHKHYSGLAQQVREGLSALGVEPLLKTHESSVALNAYHVPHSISYDTLHDGLKAQGFVIYAGQGRLARDIFRISTMGAITHKDIERLLRAFRDMVGNSAN